MGNYLSCTFIPHPYSIARGRRGALRVVLPGGEIRQFREPVNAAELMLERPGFFLANSRCLHMGRRFSPLGADQELQLGNLYVMFPMKRANSIVTAADMAAVFMASSSASKRISSAPKVGALPGNDDDLTNICTSVRGQDEAAEVILAAAPEFGYRVLGSCRSKKPSLETIKEEPPVRRRSI